MAINISSLNATEIAFIKRDGALHDNNVSKLQKGDLKDKLNEALSSGSAVNLLEGSGIDALGITGNPDGVRKSSVNYSADAFFRRDMPKVQNDNGSYSVSGVKFTEDELVQSRNFMKAAVAELKTGTLDYADYAKMGIAENAVDSFAKNSFSEEQQQILSKAIREYSEGLELEQDKILNTSGAVSNEWGELSKYYGLSDSIDQNKADAINKMKAELGRRSGKDLPSVKSGDVLGIIETATNKELISKVKDTFASINFNDHEQVDLAMKKYRELMQPAYKAAGYLERDDSALYRDTDSFMQFISTLSTSLSPATHVDFSV